MLQKLSEELVECQRRAREAAERAARATDASLKSSYLDLERRWLTLAKSYEFTDRVAAFNAETRRRIALFQPPKPPHPALPIMRCPTCRRHMRLARVEPLLDGSEQLRFECNCGAALNQASRKA